MGQACSNFGFVDVAPQRFYEEQFGFDSSEFMDMGEMGEYRFFFFGGTTIGAVCGVVNGLIVTVGRVPSLVVTLGTLYIIRGIDIWIIGGGQVVAKGGLRGSRYCAEILSRPLGAYGCSMPSASNWCCSIVRSTGPRKSSNGATGPKNGCSNIRTSSV